MWPGYRRHTTCIEHHHAPRKAIYSRVGPPVPDGTGGGRSAWFRERQGSLQCKRVHAQIARECSSKAAATLDCTAFCWQTAPAYSVAQSVYSAHWQSIGARWQVLLANKIFQLPNCQNDSRRLKANINRASTAPVSCCCAPHSSQSVKHMIMHAMQTGASPPQERLCGYCQEDDKIFGHR